MTSVSSTGTVALTILQQSRLGAPLSRADDRALVADIVSVANGVSAAGTASLKAQGKVNEALFDRSKPDVNEMKVNLFERVGKELGISIDDFESVRAYGFAIRSAVEQIKLQAGGGAFLLELEKKLGLDELGVSLDTLINAMTDPTGEDNEKLENALRAQTGDIFDEDEKEALSMLLSEETGIYGF